jgi:hypothetical protein
MNFGKARLNSWVTAAVALLALAACSGHAVGPAAIPSTSIARHGTLKASSTATTVSGTIVGMISGGFTIDPGKKCGYLHVYVNATTAITGPAPAVGLYAQATGSGSCATSLTATSLTTSASGGIPTPTPGPIPTQATITASGPIAGIMPGRLTVNAGPGVGYLHVFTNASTIYAGGTPATGLYAQSTGTGSLATSVTARYVALYSAAPGSITVSGVANAATSFGFTVNAGSSYSAVPVVMNAKTIVGGSPLVTGSTVKVTGTGTEGEGILAASIVVSAPTPAPGTTPSPTPAPISQKHLLTEDYLGSPWGTTSIAWSAAAPYITWAQTGSTSASAISAAGIKTQFYSDPNKTSPGGGDPLYSADETTFAHDCNGNRVSDVYNGVTQDVMNVSGSSLQALFVNYVNRMVASGHFDAVFEDDAGPPMKDTYVTYSGTPCSYSDASWLTAGQALNQLPSLPVIFNGLNIFNGQGPSESMAILQSANTIGGSLEHCYSDDSQPKMAGWVWQTIENSELEVAADNKLFFCVTRNLSSAASETDPRIYALASFLLTYNPTTSVLWEQYATASGFHVEPESQLVALDPLVPAPSNVSGLQQTGGTYGRQYGQCYYAGNFVGPCAVVVNPTSSSAPFPFPQYSHTLVLSGGGVLDGGTAATNGPAPPASLLPSEAAIVFP